MRALGTIGSMPSPPADMKARVLAACGVPSPTRRSARLGTQAVVLAAALLAALLFARNGGASHGYGRPLPLFASTVSVWLLAAIASLWAAVGKGRAPMGRPAPWLLAVAAGTPAVVFVVMLALAAAFPFADAAQLQRPGLSCFLLTVGAAGLPVYGLIALRRGSDAVHPGVHGAALGAAFGVCAGVMVCLWCPDVDPRHIAVGHIAPVVLLACLGGALGERVLAPSPRETI
jgi:hypothetical protein